MQQTKCIDCGDCVTRMQHRGQKHAVHELPADGEEGRRADLHADQGGVGREAGRRWMAGTWTLRRGAGKEKKFTLDAKNVILSAGSLNSTEILLRSEMNGLKVSPALGTRFSGNGNFFGLAYNSDSADQRPGIRHQAGSPRGRGDGAGSYNRKRDPLYEPAGGGAIRDRGPELPKRRRWAPPKRSSRPDRGGHGRRRRSRGARTRAARLSARTATRPTARSTTPCFTW